MADIIYRDISKLKLYEHNPRRISKKQFEKLKQSIEQDPEFFEVRPLLLSDRTGQLVVVGGNQRLRASKALGLDKVPTILMHGLSEEQERRIIIKDNHSYGSFDMDELANSWDMSELQDLGVEVDFGNFAHKDEPKHDYYGDERKRTYDAYNLGLVNDASLSADFWQMPTIKNDNFVPSDIIGFNYAKSSEVKNVGIHFYLDDYQFERVWNKPESYTDILKEYDCILSPDFSLYTDMPMPMKIWNVYRSRQIGSYYQSQGIKVIPTISWAEKETFEFAFRGIPKGSIVSISTIGVKNSEEAFKIWTDGIKEMIKQIEPSAILIYGGEVDFDYGNIKTVYYENKVTNNWKGK